MATRTTDARDPALAEALVRHQGAWAPGLVARAGYGLASVVVVATTPDGVGSVALLAPTEASALLKRLGDARGAARVAGTAAPGTAWAVGVLHAGGTSVWSLALGPYLAG